MPAHSAGRPAFGVAAGWPTRSSNSQPQSNLILIKYSAEFALKYVGRSCGRAGRLFAPLQGGGGEDSALRPSIVSGQCWLGPNLLWELAPRKVKEDEQGRGRPGPTFGHLAPIGRRIRRPRGGRAEEVWAREEPRAAPHRICNDSSSSPSVRSICALTFVARRSPSGKQSKYLPAQKSASNKSDWRPSRGKTEPAWAAPELGRAGGRKSETNFARSLARSLSLEFQFASSSGRLGATLQPRA